MTLDTTPRDWVLAEMVVDTLHKRGIEATPQQVIDWAQKMVAEYRKFRQKETKLRTWMVGAVVDHPTQTMCLHVHFGDAKSA
jgi:hypothetical protein